jgi:NADH dehydrogenase [ubiquinone] 1 alpha subcomplex assembly factor 5
MFSTRTIERNREKSRKNLYKSPFHKFICEDLLDRLEPVDRKFNNILLINPILEHVFVQNLNIKYPDHKLTIIESTEQIGSIEQKFDLIIFPFGLHWVSHVQNFLQQISKLLEPNGLFICNFPGGGTLSNLRRKLIDLESQTSGLHVPHISPFIQFEHMTPLLGQAGFTENIIDMESLELEYQNPLSLIKAVKAAGESNSLKDGISYSITKKMYGELKITQDKPFTDYVNLISFISSRTKRSITLLKEHFNPTDTL